MRISKATIHHYRSIRHLEFCCEPLVILLGPNNHGKSNILSAIDFALSTSAKPTEDDLFAFHGESSTLWVELTFHDLTDQERNTFKRYVRSDNSFTVRKTAEILSDGTVQIAYNGYEQKPKTEWLQRENAKGLTSREKIKVTGLADLVPQQTSKLKISDVQEAQDRYIEVHESELEFTEVLEGGNFLGDRRIAGGILPDFYLVPAVRDLSDEAKVKTTTVFGRLLTRAINEMTELDTNFKQVREKLDDLIKTFNASGDSRPRQLTELESNLKQELKHWQVDVAIEVVPPAIEKVFELGTLLHVDDGVKTLAELKGHGLQRAMIFALLRAWAGVLRKASEGNDDTTLKARKASESVVFAMEEPELFLHPQAQRRLASAISGIANTPDHQVFLCTHSTHFVDMTNQKSICIITKDNAEEGTKVRQCLEDIFTGGDADSRKKHFHMVSWIDPNRAEMFFARRVVFVEGQTEKTTVPFLADKLGCSDPDVSFVDCGSKHNIPLYVSVANAFQLSYVVVHDEDPLPNPPQSDWSDDKWREKRRTFELNQTIQESVNATSGTVIVLSPDFESVSQVSKSQGEKKGKPLAALDHFEAIGESEIPEKLKEVVKKIYM